MKKFILMLIIVCMLTGCSYECPSFSTTNPSDYGIYEGHIEMEQICFQGSLSIFPNKETAGMTINSYYYECEESLDNSYIIYLNASFTASAYEKEIERLNTLDYQYKGNRKTPLYTDTVFKYPAVITVFRNDFIEYALLNESDYEIVYVYCLFKMDRLKEVIPSDYQNISFSLSDLQSDDELNGYDMYAFELSELIN